MGGTSHRAVVVCHDGPSHFTNVFLYLGLGCGGGHWDQGMSRARVAWSHKSLKHLHRKGALSKTIGLPKAGPQMIETKRHAHMESSNDTLGHWCSLTFPRVIHSTLDITGSPLLVQCQALETASLYHVCICGCFGCIFLCLVISSPFIDGHFLEPKEILAGLWYEGCRPGVG